MNFSKIKNKKTYLSYSKKGVTLLLAVLTVGLVSLIVLAIAQYFREEFLMSRGIGDSVKAYYAAESGIEWGIKNHSDVSKPYQSPSPIDINYSNGSPASYELKIEIGEDGSTHIESLGSYRNVTRKLMVEVLQIP